MDNFRIQKNLSRYETFSLQLAPVREYDAHAFDFKPEAPLDVSAELAATVSAPIGLEVSVYICLPFVLGFILSV